MKKNTPAQPSRQQADAVHFAVENAVYALDDAIKALRILSDRFPTALAEGRPAGLLVMPNGSGKSRGFATLAARLDLPSLVLVHRDELLRQAVEALREAMPGVRIGTLPGDGWQDAAVLVATVQS